MPCIKKSIIAFLEKHNCVKEVELYFDPKVRAIMPSSKNKEKTEEEK
jgi:hypothetical protein